AKDDVETARNELQKLQTRYAHRKSEMAEARRLLVNAEKALQGSNRKLEQKTAAEKEAASKATAAATALAAAPNDEALKKAAANAASAHEEAVKAKDDAGVEQKEALALRDKESANVTELETQHKGLPALIGAAETTIIN
ncbi:hypothetical protein, partial [Corallococcus praedator]|uniref:hypothetical protein n=1 Tax=Corallococcus praedator TaxID=2316724 RepID=UPI001ABF92C6